MKLRSQTQKALGVGDAIEFLALLAYPKEPSQRSRATRAMKAYWLRSCKDAGTFSGPLSTTMKSEQMWNQLHRLSERLNKRLVAASDCVALELEVSEEGETVPIPSADRQELLRWAAANNVPSKRLLLTMRVPGRRLSLNDIARDRGASGPGHEKYKTDWWRPEVMHLGIALRSSLIRIPAFQPILSGKEWIASPVRPDVRWLLSLWPDWIEHALRIAPLLAADLIAQESAALQGFKKTTFLFPDACIVEFR